ncbi:hypothetical protein ABZ506_07155 [Streptomyces lavendulocolor]
MSDQPRDRHIRRAPSGFRPTVPPANTRPYRRLSEAGPEMRTVTLDRNQLWRQVGWHGQTGAFYALDEKPADHEPGSFGPLWVLVDSEPPILPDDEVLDQS